MTGSYFSILRRRLFFLVQLSIVLGGLIYVALSSGGTDYRSTAVIEVGSGAVAESVLGQDGPYVEPERRIATAIEAFGSAQVSATVADRLAEEGVRLDADEVASRISASARRATDYIEVTGTAAQPAAAQRLTTYFVDAYFDYRRELERRELLALQLGLQERLDTARAELEALPADEPADSFERSVILDRVNNAQDLLEAVQLRLSVDTSPARLLAAASLPTEPAGALSEPLKLVASLLGGLALAAAVVFALELARDPLRTRQEAQRLFPIPVLGEIPCQRATKGGHSDPRAVGLSKEARSLRLRLAGLAGDGRVDRVLLVAMPDDEDAGLCVAVALAGAVADTGMRVLLVTSGPPAHLIDHDADAPRVPAALQTVLKGVSVMQSTRTGAGAAGMFDSPSPADALAAASSHFDLTIVVLAGKDGVPAAAVGQLFPVVLAVCALGSTRARRFRDFVDQLRLEGVPPTAIVTTAAPRARFLGRQRAQDARASRDDRVSGALVPEAEPVEDFDPSVATAPR